MGTKAPKPGSSPSPRTEVWLVLALGAVIEAAASYPWYLLLHYTIDDRGTAAVGPGSLLLFAFGGALLGVALERRHASPGWSRWLTGPGGVVLAAGWLALTPAVWRGSLIISALTLLWNWHRGLVVARDEEDHGLALHRFAMAVVRTAIALVALLLFRVWGDASALRAAGARSGLVLLAAGLLLLAATHQTEVRKNLAARGTPAADRSRFWGSVAVIATVLALAVALEGSRLLTSMPPALVYAILAPIHWLLDHIIEVLIRIIVTVVGPILTAFLVVLRRGSAVLIGLQNLFGRITGQQPVPTPGLAPTAPALIARGIALLLLAALAAVLLARGAFRRSRQRELDEGLVEVHESVWDWANLAPGSWLDALRAWLRGRSDEAGDGGNGLEPLGPAWDLRRLYRRFLLLGAELGRGRQPAETPRQYQQVFTAAPQDGTALQAKEATDPPAPPALPATAQALTAAYEAVRYGEREPDPVEVAGIRQQLADLEAALAGRTQSSSTQQQQKRQKT